MGRIDGFKLGVLRLQHQPVQPAAQPQRQRISAWITRPVEDAASGLGRIIQKRHE